MKQYVILRKEERILSYLLDDRRAVEIHVDPVEQHYALNDIYIARVRDIAKNIGAAFVEIAKGQVCYLALNDLKHPIYTKKGACKDIQQGDELVVQICREGIKTKFPSVSTNLIFHGKYLLLTAGNRSLSVSSKLSSPDRERLLGLLRSWRKENVRPADEHGDYGFLARTNAAAASEVELRREYLALRTQYEELVAKARFQTCFSCIRKSPAAYLSRLANIYDTDAQRVITDDAALYQEILAYYREHQPRDLEKLAFYKDQLQTLEKHYGLEQQLKQALSPKVWLTCGGYLMIEPTEALTVIDVNSGKYETRKNREAAFLKVNLEAAKEIARQLRLRNLSGIVVVDFINMELAASNCELLETLARELKRDPIPTVLVDQTKLALVEITRKKKEKSLAQAMAQT